MTLRFDDGMEFDTGGELRVVRRRDGWYVVGQGILAAVDDPEDGERLIEKLRHGGGRDDELRT
jgi:hypothetical protein